MTESEGRALMRAASVLFVASLARWGLTRATPAPLIPPDSANALPALMEESRKAREEAQMRSTPLGDDELLDPNRAPAWELDRLPGVGPATADAIVEVRESGGPFQRSQDLLSVRGIGPATVERIAGHLDFSSPPPPRPLRRPQPSAGVPLVGAGGRAGGVEGDAAASPVELNTASRQELEALPGIGPALAGRILQAREQRGRFSSPEDLLDVRGIGPVLLKRLRPLVVVR